MIQHLKKYTKSIILIILGIMLFSCENDLATVESLKINENTPIESTYNVNTEISDSGKLTSILKSPEVHRYINNDEEYIEMPKGINLIFYDSAGNIKSSITSEYAINLVDKKIMEARINVIATNSKGEKLYTEELIWDQKNHTIYSGKQVKVIDKNSVLFGDGLKSDETFDNWHIIRPHDGNIEFEDIEEEPNP